MVLSILCPARNGGRFKTCHFVHKSDRRLNDWKSQSAAAALSQSHFQVQYGPGVKMLQHCQMPRLPGLVAKQQVCARFWSDSTGAQRSGTGNEAVNHYQHIACSGLNDGLCHHGNLKTTNML